MITRLARYSIGFILAVLVAEVLGAAFQVQGNIRQQFAPLGIEVPLAEQLAWTWRDIKGLLPTYGQLLAIGFFIAFIVAAFVARLMPRLRTVVFMVSGALAVLTIFVLAKPVFFGVSPIFGARDALGMGLQGVAGAVAGWIFALVTRRKV